jgi:nitroreductase
MKKSTISSHISTKQLNKSFHKYVSKVRSFCQKQIIKLPLVKKYKQINFSKLSTREIIGKSIKEVSSYLFWYMYNFSKIRYYGLHHIKKYSKLNFEKLSTQEILSAAKHEAHRIEKAFYAGYLKTSKYSVYNDARETLSKAIHILRKRGEFEGRADSEWLLMIHDSFYTFDKVIAQEKKPPPTFVPKKITEYIDFAKDRRSTRTWAQPNLPEEELFEIAKSLIECAKWSPNSGNRQPWYFKILIKNKEKELLKGIKEEHLIRAPLVIFLGLNRTSYGAIGKREQGIHVDGGAAAMQMIMAAQNAGLGSCWNHFCTDLIYSRPKNLPIFKNFYKKMNIPKDIEPIALLAFGKPAFISPPPERPPFKALCPQI